MTIFPFLLLPTICFAVSTWDACFDKLPNRTLIGASIVIKEDISLSSCQNACLEFLGDRCRSISYSEFDGRCELNKEDHRTSPRGLLPAVGWMDYYFRTCYDKPSVAVRRDESQFTDNCFQTTPGKILIGIVDELIQDTASLEDCRKACQKRQGTGAVCKSAAYSSKEKECIIASQSKNDIPELYIDDDKYVYIENVCLTGGTKSDDKVIAPKTTTSKPISDVSESAGLETMGTLPETKPTKGGIKDYLFARKPAGARKSPQKEPSGYDFGITGDNTEDVLTTTIHTTKTPALHRNVEQSGYESNAVGIIGAGEVDLLPTTTPKPIPPVAAKLVDNYAVESTPKSTGYGRRLRDDRVKTCFQEVRPLYAMIESRVAKAYSLEQCTDICRLCFRCLRGKKCRSVAYDRSKELCALSITPLIDGGDDATGIIFHNRVDAAACDPFPIRSART